MATPDLAQCPRCQGFTLVGLSATQILVAVDVMSLNAQGFANALVSGVGLWAVEKTREGTPGRLVRPPGGPRPSWGANGQQTGTQPIHAEHSCGVLAQDMRKLKPEAPSGPRSAPVTPGVPGAGIPPHDALDAGARALASRFRARHASRHLSDLGPVRCATCDRIVDQRKPYVAIQCGAYRWANCEECP